MLKWVVLMKLFLDDLRFPLKPTWTIARSYDEAVRLVEQYGFPSKVSFDHDLGDGPTGCDFAHYLINLDLDKGLMPEHFSFRVHSANPIGAANIEGLLSGYLRWKFGDV